MAERGPRIAVNTHHHPDPHVRQRVLPASTTIIGHHLCREGVLRAGLKATEELPADYGDLVVRPPDLTVGSDITLHLGEFPVELQVMGPAHSTHDIGVWLPEQKVFFAGDLAFSGGHPIFLEGSMAGFRTAVRRMRDLEPNALLPVTVPPVGGTRGRVGCSTTSRGTSTGSRRSPASPTPPVSRPWRRLRSTREGRTPTGRRANGWSATCTGPTPRSTRRTSLRSPSHPGSLAGDGRPQRWPDRLPRLSRPRFVSGLEGPRS